MAGGNLRNIPLNINLKNRNRQMAHVEVLKNKKSGQHELFAVCIRPILDEASKLISLNIELVMEDPEKCQLNFIQKPIFIETQTKSTKIKKKKRATPDYKWDLKVYATLENTTLGHTCNINNFDPSKVLVNDLGDIKFDIEKSKIWTLCCGRVCKFLFV